MPASASFFLQTSRIFWSSTSSAPKVFLGANQRLPQAWLTPTRKPTGLTFCPISYLAPFFALGASSLSTTLQWQRRRAIGCAEPRAVGQ